MKFSNVFCFNIYSEYIQSELITMRMQISIKMLARHEKTFCALQTVNYVWFSLSEKEKGWCIHDDVKFLAKVKACWYFHLQISRRWLWNYISSAVSHSPSSLTYNFSFPDKYCWKIPLVWLFYLEINVSNSTAGVTYRWRRWSLQHHKSWRWGFEANEKIEECAKTNRIK